MSFRGGRGGRGRGSFCYNAATPQAFKLFPEDVQLPDARKVPMDTDYCKWSDRLKMYFKKSAYVIEESDTTYCKNHDIERYSDSLEAVNKMKRDCFTDFTILKPGYFPRELIKGVKPVSSQKKVKWDPAAADKRMFEDLEKKEKAKGEKETDSEEEEEIDEEEDQGEFSDDGDYGQNQDFDDDEDDYNDKDDDDGEAFY